MTTAKVLRRAKENIVYVEEVATWRNWKKRECGLYTVLSRWGKTFHLKQVHGAIGVDRVNRVFQWRWCDWVNALS